MNDIYGRGIAGATRGWEDLMRGIREGTQGMMQGLQTKELIKQQKREKEYIETKDRAEGIFQRFTQGLYNLKDMGAIDEYKNTVSKSDKALVLQMTGYSLDTIADTYTANLRGLETKAKEDIALKEKIWQEHYETEQAGRIGLKGAPAWQAPPKPEKPEVMTPAQTSMALERARDNLKDIEKEMADSKDKKDRRYMDLERDRKEALDEVKKYQKMLGLTTAPTMEEIKRNMPYQFQGLPWMTQPSRGESSVKSYEDIRKRIRGE